MSFLIPTFIDQCVAALNADDPQTVIAQLLREALSDPATVLATLGSPEQAAVQRLYVADDLTITNITWTPKMTLPPHTHNMWAVIGVYTGREDNIFWRRIHQHATGNIEAAGAKSVAAGDVITLDEHVIHSVTNPTPLFTGAIHVYGGNFFEMERSEWDTVSLTESVYDTETRMALFDDENALLPYRHAGQ